MEERYRVWFAREDLNRFEPDHGWRNTGRANISRIFRWYEGDYTGENSSEKFLERSRHGQGHRFLPHQINHRANLLALKEAGGTAVVSFSVCGLLRSDWPLAAPLLATDLFFPENRLGDGSACTLFTEPGEPGRGAVISWPVRYFIPDFNRRSGTSTPKFFPAPTPCWVSASITPTGLLTCPRRWRFSMKT